FKAKHAPICRRAKEVGLQQHGKECVSMRGRRVADDAVRLGHTFIVIVFDIDGELLIKLDRARAGLCGLSQIKMAVQAENDEKFVKLHDHSKGRCDRRHCRPLFTSRDKPWWGSGPPPCSMPSLVTTKARWFRPTRARR